MGSLNWTVFMVFLVLLGRELPQGGEVQYGKVTRGSQKMMHFTVFLKLPGLGGLGMVMASIWDCTAG